MKIRIHANTVRLRLERDEVDAIARTIPVEETTAFPSGRFGYRLSIAEVTAPSADFTDGVIEVRLPRRLAVDWASNESEVSIRGSVALEAETLSLLIEKDFECLEPRAGETQKNRFPNPKARA